MFISNSRLSIYEHQNLMEAMDKLLFLNLAHEKANAALYIVQKLIAHSLQAQSYSVRHITYKYFSELRGDRITCTLREQYRMHRDIVDWSSRSFYGGRITNANAVDQHLLCDLARVKRTPETGKNLCSYLSNIDTIIVKFFLLRSNMR